jgi:beta-glucosidase
VTVVRSLDQLPPFEDYSMIGRTYRYMNGEPLYPFGFGLSYTSFRYGALELASTRLAPGDDLAVSGVVENVGPCASDDVVQLYLSDLEGSTRVPRWSLAGFQRVHVAAGAKAVVRFTIPARRMALIDDRGRCLLEPGSFRVFLGGSQPDGRSRSLGSAAPVQADFALEGRTKEIAY